MREILPGAGVYQSEPGCPHLPLIQYCPLYVAAHHPELSRFGCDDGQLGSGECAIDREGLYPELMAQLYWADPGFVREILDEGQKAARERQRARNAALLGSG